MPWMIIRVSIVNFKASLLLLSSCRDADLDSMINTGELVGENSDDMIKLVLIEKREHQQKMHKV